MHAARTLRIAAIGLVSLAMPATAVAHSSSSHKHHQASRHHARRVSHHSRRHARPRRHARLVVAVKPRSLLLRAHAARNTGPIAIAGTTYYVSPSGSDSNSGTSPSQPWRTVDHVNSAKLHPGDGVLFQGGATFADDTLMPGWGVSLSGAPGSQIVFGSYGSGRASLPKGIWFKSDNWLSFENLSVSGPQQGVNGTGDDITIQSCSFADVGLGIQSHGSNWTIEDNMIDRTGDSGMLLYGDSEHVSSNTITNTGLDTSIPYGTHGIYLKAPNSTVTGNTISNFHDDGVSVRYRDSVVSDNRISGGAIGIAWFQYDTVRGTSRWTDNVITDTTAAGIFVSGDAHINLESFVIDGNTIAKAAGVYTNFHPTGGRYSIAHNSMR